MGRKMGMIMLMKMGRSMVINMGRNMARNMVSVEEHGEEHGEDPGEEYVGSCASPKKPTKQQSQAFERFLRENAGIPSNALTGARLCTPPITLRCIPPTTMGLLRVW